MGIVTKTNPTSMHTEFSIGRDTQTNPNPMHKQLSTVTYGDIDTTGMVHRGLTIYRTLWDIGYGPQRG